MHPWVFMQRAIESLHGYAIDLDVRAYLIDNEVRDAIPGARADLPEQLFVRQDDDGMEVALYIAPGIVRRLRRDDPLVRLHAGNLEPTCIALEGISHFVFLVWRASLGRPVSALELEIQAEVDKFVFCWMLLAEQGTPFGIAGVPLLRRLFEAVEVRAGALSESGRYLTANRVARRVCADLVEQFGRDRDGGRIRREVRLFCRQGLADKVRKAA